jgi:hypothetical protein
MARSGGDAANCCVLIDSRSAQGSRHCIALTLLGLAAVSGAGCNRPETPPTPVVPVQPMQPQAATPDAPTVPIPPPPKEAPANAQPDAPQLPTTAPSAVPDKPAEPHTPQDKPAADVPATVPAAVVPLADAKKSKGAKTLRDIHPNPGSTGCLEMYGTCTPPPDQLCTSSAFYLDCGKIGQLPSNGEMLRCVCP